MYNPENYQEWTRSTAIYPSAGGKDLPALMYCALGLCGEAGEVADKVKKLYRDGMDFELTQNVKKELADVMWYLARVADELGMTLSELMDMSYRKLEDRKARNVIGGSGDNR